MEIKATLANGDELLSRLEQLILANLENQQFGVESLAGMMGTSRSNLHRLITSRTGNNVSHFIRDVRLNEALKLLAGEDATMAEIGYRVGFNSNTYFNKCFSDRYGMPPGEARHILRGDEPLSVPEENPSFTEGSTMVYENGRAADSPSRKSNLQKIWSRNRRPIAWMLTMVIIVLTATVLYNFQPNPSDKKPSLAVLPLEFQAEDNDQVYLAAGMQDALINELSRINELRVISRTSSMNIDRTNKALSTIGEGLAVDMLIRGSVILQGDSVRVTLQLIKTDQEKPAWTREYTQSLGSIFSLYSKVTLDVADGVEIMLQPDERKSLTTVRQVDPDMYKAYLRGMYFINQSTHEDFMKGINYLQEAVRMDPAEPMAYAKLAVGYNSINHGPEPDAMYWKLARASALRAIRLDSMQAEAHAALAMIKTYFEHDWEGAEKEFKTALQINPSMASAHFHYAWYLVIEGKTEEAFYHHRLARELDPLLPINTADLGSLHMWVLNYKEAESLAREALEMNPGFGHAYFVLGNALVQQGRYEEAISAHEKADSINSSWRWLLANTLVIAGKKDKAMELVRELEQEPVSTRDAFGLGWIYMSLGDMDKAFEWMERNPPDPWLAAIATWPEFEPMQKDPRFPGLMKKLRIIYDPLTQTCSMDKRPLHNLNDPAI